MSERKVLTKYYPPDFDPSAIARTRRAKDSGPRLQTVRLMAPFSMKCIKCGEFIYKGRKFNARKETTEEKYYQIPIYRFYIRCTRCSAELTFRTDPKNMDYECEKGAKRNFEPWREAKLAEETEEERLDRIEREEAEHDAMAELESKAMDAKTEMAIADSLDRIRTKNARAERAVGNDAALPSQAEIDLLEQNQDQEDINAARLAFLKKKPDHLSSIEEELKDNTFNANTEQGFRSETTLSTDPDYISLVPFTKARKKGKKDFGASLGIKKRLAD